MREIVGWTLTTLWLLFWWFVIFHGAAFAEDGGRTVQVLVQGAIAEADSNPIDRAVTWHVLKRRAARKGVTIDAMAESYVSAFHARSTPRLRWVLSVDETCTEPEGFPSNEVWSPKRCARAFKDAHAFLRGELKNPCLGSDQWGSPTLPEDVARAARAVREGRWIPVACAGAANRFFHEVLR